MITCTTIVLRRLQERAMVILPCLKNEPKLVPSHCFQSIMSVNF